MREVTLPSEFAELSNSVQYVQRKSPHEYSSSCPKCGGCIHPDGEPPDRFVLLMPERSYAGIPFGFCRVCGYKWWQGQDGNKNVDPAVIAELERQAKAAETKRNADRLTKLQQFSTGELWNELHRRMGEEQRGWWMKNGIPEDWQDYLRLGYTPKRSYRTKTGYEYSPAYTIPYFGYGFVFKTMQYRLCNPSALADRYRFEQDLGTSFYMTTPSQKIGDEVVVCEGAKKGMVVKIWGEPNITVLSVPSKNDWRNCGVLEEVKDCGRIYIWFDPDCFIRPANAGNNWQPQPVLFANEIGNNARVIECPVKADDAFIHYHMDMAEMFALKRQAFKVRLNTRTKP